VQVVKGQLANLGAYTVYMHLHQRKHIPHCYNSIL